MCGVTASLTLLFERRDAVFSLIVRASDDVQSAYARVNRKHDALRVEPLGPCEGRGVYSRKHLGEAGSDVGIDGRIRDAVLFANTELV